jgi:aspartate racemase
MDFRVFVRNDHGVQRIGLLGGMSWESTAVYYRLINEGVRDRLGGLHSADLVLRSLDFAPIERLQAAEAWDEAGELLAAEAEALSRAGAQLLLVCTNTMHRVADTIAEAIPIPLLHIADATAAALRSAGVRTVGLLGTAYTMEQDFYVGRLRDRHGIDVLVPPADDRRLVHRIIYDELVAGRVTPSSRRAYGRVMADLAARDAQAILFGCTEIGLLVGPDDAPVPTFDSTAVHAAAAVDAALQTVARSQVA